MFAPWAKEKTWTAPEKYSLSNPSTHREAHLLAHYDRSGADYRTSRKASGRQAEINILFDPMYLLAFSNYIAFLRRRSISRLGSINWLLRLFTSPQSRPKNVLLLHKRSDEALTFRTHNHVSINPQVLSYFKAWYFHNVTFKLKDFLHVNFAVLFVIVFKWSFKFETSENHNFCTH